MRSKRSLISCFVKYEPLGEPLLELFNQLVCTEKLQFMKTVTFPKIYRVQLKTIRAHTKVKKLMLRETSFHCCKAIDSFINHSFGNNVFFSVLATDCIHLNVDKDWRGPQ